MKPKKKQINEKTEYKEIQEDKGLQQRTKNYFNEELLGTYH